MARSAPFDAAPRGPVLRYRNTFRTTVQRQDQAVRSVENPADAARSRAPALGASAGAGGDPQPSQTGSPAVHREKSSGPVRRVSAPPLRFLVDAAACVPSAAQPRGADAPAARATCPRTREAPPSASYGSRSTRGRGTPLRRSRSPVCKASLHRVVRCEAGPTPSGSYWPSLRCVAHWRHPLGVKGHRCVSESTCASI